MSWLRIDDAFTSHPKVLALGTDARRWTWLSVLAYTCRYRSPVVPPTIGNAVPRATPSFLAACGKLGLIDVQEDGSLIVHDWAEYNSRASSDDAEPLALRVEAYLAEHPTASANEVVKALHSNRAAVLGTIRELRGEPTPELVPRNRSGGSSELVPPRARVPSRPVPSPEEPPDPGPAPSREAEATEAGAGAGGLDSISDTVRDVLGIER